MILRKGRRRDPAFRSPSGSSSRKPLVFGRAKVRVRGPLSPADVRIAGLKQLPRVAQTASRSKSSGSKRRSRSKSSPSANVAGSIPALEVFQRMAAGQRRLGLAKQARTGVEMLWLSGSLTPSQYDRKLREIESASARFDALVSGVVERGRIKDWNAPREKAIRSAEQWADAFSMMLDFRNIYERIYRGAPAYSAPALTKEGRRELAAFCRDRKPCEPPCRSARVGVLRRRRCAGPR
jgi:hypothetical protein